MHPLVSLLCCWVLRISLLWHRYLMSAFPAIFACIQAQVRAHPWASSFHSILYTKFDNVSRCLFCSDSWPTYIKQGVVRYPSVISAKYLPYTSSRLTLPDLKHPGGARSLQSIPFPYLLLFKFQLFEQQRAWPYLCFLHSLATRAYPRPAHTWPVIGPWHIHDLHQANHRASVDFSI